MKTDEEYRKIWQRLKDLQEVFPLSDIQSFAFNRIHGYLEAKRLGLKYFHYAGATYEDSKPFCKARCGKVFSIEEMFDWVNASDRPKRKDYDPLLDMGGNKCIDGFQYCNHGMNFITEKLAKEYRPDIIIEEKKIERPDYSKLDNNSRIIIEKKMQQVQSQFSGPKLLIVQATFDKFVRDYLEDSNITFNDAQITLTQAVELIGNNLLEKLPSLAIPEIKLTVNDNPPQ